MPNRPRALAKVVLGVGLFLLGSFAVWTPATPMPQPAQAPILGAAYAAPLETVDTHVLQRGQTLSDVLMGERLSEDMADLLLTLRQFANPRRLAAGAEISVHRWREDGMARSVEVRLNADSTVRLDRGAVGWDGHVEVTPTHEDTVFVAGSIEQGRTLYEALVYDDQLDLPVTERVQLVGRLAEIYGYKLDFAHEIQPGDKFRVVYEREARPDGTARSRRILAAEIQNSGHIYRAFYFRPDEEPYGSYYDENGKSLRLAFRRYPIDYVRITSTFNPRRYHPVLGIYRAHTGTDFGATAGTPAHSTAKGTVTFAGRKGGYGNMVEIRHWNGYTTRYAHLRAFARGIRPGVKVDEYQVIGYVGMTGLATAPHLHYEIRKGGAPLNPATVKLPGAPPLPAPYLTQFKSILSARVALLDRIAGGTRLAVTEAGRDAVMGTRE